MKRYLCIALLFVGCAGVHGAKTSRDAVLDIQRIIRGLNEEGLVPIKRESVTAILPQSHGERSVFPQLIDSQTVSDLMWEVDNQECSAYFSVTRADQPEMYGDIRVRCSVLTRNEAVQAASRWMSEIITATAARQLAAVLAKASGGITQEFQVTRKDRAVRVLVFIEDASPRWNVGMDIEDRPSPAGIVNGR